MRNVLHIEIVYKDAKDHGSLGFRLTELFSNSGHIEIWQSDDPETDNNLSNCSNGEQWQKMLCGGRESLNTVWSWHCFM